MNSELTSLEKLNLFSISRSKVLLLRASLMEAFEFSALLEQIRINKLVTKINAFVRMAI